MIKVDLQRAALKFLGFTQEAIAWGKPLCQGANTIEDRHEMASDGGPVLKGHCVHPPYTVFEQ
jgi:hypothetical protein